MESGLKLPPPRAPQIRNREYRLDEWALVLPPALYDAAEAGGYDMRYYRKSTPIPTNPRTPPRG